MQLRPTEGSEAGLRRFIRGELVAAAIHLHALDDETLDANRRARQFRNDGYIESDQSHFWGHYEPSPIS